MKKILLQWEQVRQMSYELSHTILNDLMRHPLKIWGIPRGGSIVVSMLMSLTENDRYCFHPVDNLKDADIILDDIYDSGETAKKYKKYKKPIYFLVDKRLPKWKNKWIIFPWEIEDTEKDLKDYVLRLFETFNHDYNKVTKYINLFRDKK